MIQHRLNSKKGFRKAHLVDQLHLSVSALCVGFVQCSQLLTQCLCAQTVLLFWTSAMLALQRGPPHGRAQQDHIRGLPTLHLTIPNNPAE